MPTATRDPERPYAHPEGGPFERLRRDRCYSLIELIIATSDRKTAGALERNILQPFLVCTAQTI